MRGSSCFQPGEGPSRGLLRDCTTSQINRLQHYLGHTHGVLLGGEAGAHDQPPHHTAILCKQTTGLSQYCAHSTKLDHFLSHFTGK